MEFKDLLDSFLNSYLSYALFLFIMERIVANVSDWSVKLKNKLNENDILKKTYLDDYTIDLAERIIHLVWKNGSAKKLKSENHSGAELAKRLLPEVSDAYLALTTGEKRKELDYNFGNGEKFIISLIPFVLDKVKKISASHDASVSGVAPSEKK